MTVVPLTFMNEQKATWAYEVHCALLKAEVREPALRDNPRWRRLREAAFADFELSFVKTGVV